MSEEGDAPPEDTTRSVALATMSTMVHVGLHGTVHDVKLRLLSLRWKAGILYMSVP